MSMTFAVADHLTTVLAQTSGDTIATAIRNFIAPLVLLAVGIAALSFLFKRQMTEFLQFIALAIGVAIFFYVPGVVEKIATTIANVF